MYQPRRAASAPLLGPRGAPIRVAIVDDHRIFAEMLAETLAAEGGVVTWIAPRLDALPALLAEQPPADVALVDYLLPDGRGTDAIAAIRRAWPACRCLLFTGLENDDVFEEAVASGADGVLMKRLAGADDVADAVRRAAAGEILLDPSFLTRLVRRTAAGSFRSGQIVEKLTPRERAALEVLLEAGGTEAAAERLGIAPSTYRVHLHNAMAKLGADGRLDAISRALKAGVIRPPEVVLGGATDGGR